MTSEEALHLRPGYLVEVYWNMSNTGTNSKKARVVKVNAAGTKVAVNVERTTPAGKYTGQYGKETRWFSAEEILGVDMFEGR